MGKTVERSKVAWDTQLVWSLYGIRVAMRDKDCLDRVHGTHCGLVTVRLVERVLSRIPTPIQSRVRAGTEDHVSLRGSCPEY
jgi:hypothetical protein